MQKKFIFSLVAALSLLLPSCFSTTGDALMCTASFSSEVQPNTPYAFYRVGEQYYLTCEVAYRCERDELDLAFVPFNGGDEHWSVPAGVNRDPVRKRFYFLLPPDVANKVLGVTPPPVPEGAAYCMPADAWDAAAAVQFDSPLKKAELHVRCESGNVPCRYWSDPAQFELTVPKYRLWDYWVKWPFGVVLLVGVDVPLSVVGSVGRFVGEELFTWLYVVPTQQHAMPVEVKHAAD